MSSSKRSFGTELLISSKVTASSVTQAPIYSDNAPKISTSQATGIPRLAKREFT